MGIPSVRKHGQLQEQVGRDSSNNGLLADLIESVYRLRIIRLPATTSALTIDRTLLGALIISTSATGLAITLPVNTVGKGFVVSVLTLGAGSVTFSGTHVGGTTAATGVTSNAYTIDDGSWVVGGAS